MLTIHRQRIQQIVLGLKTSMEISKLYKSRILFFFLFLGLVSLQAQTRKSMNTKEYIDSFKRYAMFEMSINGVPASITLAQGILESASGNSKLCLECNNHFGIKCRKNWNGNFCLADDDAKDECFRGYANPIESYRDHSLFLKGSQRYATLFELDPTDYKAWSHGLREAGYATNPEYGNLLIRVIERNRLSQYDSMVVLGQDFYKAGSSPVIEYNGLPAVAVRPGNTAADIARENQLAEWKLYKYNDLEKNQLINPGEILYLKPKRTNASEQIHIMKRGETLHDVSQLYAIKLKSLRKMNQLNSNEEPVIGEEIYLNEKRDSKPKTTSGHIPMSTATAIMRPAASNATKNIPNTHEVQSGETIEQIAEKYRTSVLNIVRWNDLEFAEVSAGQILALAPGIKGVSNIQSVSEVKVQMGDINSELKNVSIHYVKPGETLFRISTMYGVSVDQIKKLNGMNNNAIRAGQKLKIR